MIKALSTAATGLEAQQRNIERISNEVANVNTDAYKKSRTEFHDLMYDTIRQPGVAQGQASVSPVGVQTGNGVRVGASYKIFEPGPARMTYNKQDLMIEGQGFFPVLHNGQEYYTRNGAFHLDAQGRLQLSNGAQMVPPIVVPPNALDFNVSSTGEVKVVLSDGNEQVLGQIQLVQFVNPQGLMSAGEGLYRSSPASGQAQRVIAGEAGTGAIAQGQLEGSNVNIANSMTELITTQRGYEMGTQVMKVADQMLGATAQIK